MLNTYLTIVLAPLIGSIVVGLAGNRLGRTLSHSITILGVTISTVLSFYVFNHHVLNEGEIFNQNIYTWMQIGGLNISFGFLVDNLTSVMLVVVSFISLMVLYSDKVSPLGHAVRIVLAEKDVNVEINYIDDDKRPEILNELNPYNTILTLIDRDLVLYDPQIIMEYLDERFPHPPLMPVDPVSRASNRQLRYRVMNDLYSMISDIDSDNEIAAANAKKVLRDNLTAIAPVFLQTSYFMSEDYTLVDCCIAPLMWRLTQYGIKLPMSGKPLQEYSNRLFERQSFSTSLSSEEKEYHEH